MAKVHFRIQIRTYKLLINTYSLKCRPNHLQALFKRVDMFKVKTRHLKLQIQILLVLITERLIKAL
jgi:hypothetical protein